MSIPLDEVIARWTSDGNLQPLSFVWQGRNYRVEGVGRQWLDEEGQHVLCMAAGGVVYELILLVGQGWKLEPPVPLHSTL